MIRAMKDSTGAKTPELSDVRKEETFPIMTINMNGHNQGKGSAHKRKELIISTINNFSASVIFCQEVPGCFKDEVVPKCGTDGNSYEFVRPKDIYSGNFEVAVMWRETDFQGKEVTLTDPSLFEAIVERLIIKEKKFDVDVIWATIRSAMVKLTSRRTKASFLAVSWHGPWKNNKASGKTKLEVLYDLIRLLRVVCEKEELSSFIIGGDFNFNTRKVDQDRQTEYGVTILRYELCARDKGRGHSFVPYKDTFIFSIPSGKLPMTVDITVSPGASLELQNGSGPRALLDHEPVVGHLKVVCTYKKPPIKQDRGNEENDTIDKEKRHSSGEDEKNEKKIIEAYVKNQGKYIKPVLRDGHCMLYAFRHGLNEKDGQGDYSVAWLSTEIENELLNNLNFYSVFDDIKGEDIKAYIHGKEYNSSVADFIPYVVANITNTSIGILQVQYGQVNTLVIPPRNMEPGRVERIIYVCKIGNHYDAILDEEAASDLKIGDTQWSTPQPETKGTAKADSGASGVRKKLFEDELTSCSRQSPSAIPNGYVTLKDFESLFSFVERSFNSIHAKIDSLTAEVEEIKLAIKQAQPTEPHSETTEVSESPVLDQGSDRESTAAKKQKEKKINK